MTETRVLLGTLYGVPVYQGDATIMIDPGKLLQILPVTRLTWLELPQKTFEETMREIAEQVIG